jgi:hypothetical protein
MSDFLGGGGQLIFDFLKHDGANIIRDESRAKSILRGKRNKNQMAARRK